MKKLFFALIAACSFAAPATAQNLFDPAARVDDAIITNYEVEQRIRFLQTLNAPGATRQAAIDALIDDRLRSRAAASVGLQITEDGLQSGLTNFAAQGNMTTEQFTAALQKSGVAPETFRDFVQINIIWRDLIRARYGNRVSITEAEIDRALSETTGSSNIRVLLSEIIMPAPEEEAEAVMARAEEISQTRSEAEFSNYARNFSATATRDRGGRLPWTPITNLPAQLRPLILGLGIGEVTQPLALPDAVALFQLRGIAETGTPTKEYAAIEYAAYYLPGGRSEATLAQAADIAGRVDVCDDLYGIAKGQPEEVLERGALPPSEIPQDIAIELAKLDTGEISTALTRSNGETLVFLMMCGRTAATEDDTTADREGVAASLRNRRLTAFADSLLAELRAASDITVFE